MLLVPPVVALLVLLEVLLESPVPLLVPLFSGLYSSSAPPQPVQAAVASPKAASKALDEISTVCADLVGAFTAFEQNGGGIKFRPWHGLNPTGESPIDEVGREWGGVSIRTKAKRDGGGAASSQSLVAGKPPARAIGIVSR